MTTELLPRELRAPDGRVIVLRRGEEADAAAVLAYFRRVGAETENLTFGGEGIPLTEDEERAHIVGMRGDNAIFVIAECAGEIAGIVTFAGGKRQRLRHVGEFGISVARAFWGAGVGPALMRVLLDWAAATGVVRKLNLKVRTDNARAIALYERLGFVVEGRTTRDMLIDGVFTDCLIMGLEIDPPAGA